MTRQDGAHDPARAACNAGIEADRQMALIATKTIESRDGSGIVCDRAAVAALQGSRRWPRGGVPRPPAGHVQCLVATIAAEVRSYFVLLRVSRRTLAVGPDEAGFCPVISRPSMAV